MDTGVLFPFAQYWWVYAVFTAGILGLLLLDLGVFHRKSHAVSMKESLVWSTIWISLGLVFGLGLWQWSGAQLAARGIADAAAHADRIGLEYLSGFVVEKALAVDNLFVIAMIFAYFHVPAAYQHRVLFFGILGALVFRALFIAAGAALMQYHWVIVVAGLFLIFTGVKMLFMGDSKVDPDKNPLIRLLRKLLPVTPDFRGEKFFVRDGGRLWATPLLVCLVFIEVSDIVFAIDSVPAIFALTKEPLVVFTSNVFAILGLRSLYFLLAGVMDKFHLLKVGLAFILVFVGLKMVWLDQAFGGKFPIGWSLGIIGGMLVVSMVASLVIAPKAKAAE
ncbi:MAG: TerC family protein [Fibrobacterota bacterium]|nr:TerC family protein [Fibrobacterota bacterium]QQS06556.1 MAG: TerC family protein [Fibrobacterota bacterium]